MRILYCFIFLVAFSLQAEARFNKIFLKSGNIYFIQDNNQTLQLTSAGLARSPILSPDKKSIAFIKVGTDPLPEQCRNFADTNSRYGKQIWIIDVERKKERLLVNYNFACAKPMEMIIAPHHLTFSPDSKTLYFLTYAWTTSNALHAVNIVDAKQRYLLPANSLAVATDEEYKGNLILNQHRYFIGGGSYDWYWLFTPEGKEIGPLGEEPSIK
jgi:hypothetical protein